MISKDELYDMYWEQGMNQLEIGDEIGVQQSAVSKWMKKFGIKRRTKSESKLGNTVKPPKKEIKEMYWGQGMTQAEIGNEIGVQQKTIWRWMQEFGIKRRTLSEVKLKSAVKLLKEEIEDMYRDKGMSQLEIAKNIGVSSHTISSWMKEFGIERRTLSELVSGENHPNWKGGISFEPYCEKFNNTFKEAVRKRDDFMCKLCGCTQNDNGRKLDVHHIHYDKENCYPDVVALCRSCNIKVNTNRDYWENYFEDQLLERGLFCWSILS